MDRKAQTIAEASATSNVAPRVLEVGAATPAPARRKMRQDAAEGVGAVDGDALAGGARRLGSRSDERAGLSATGACCGSSGRLEMPEQAGAGQRIAVQLQAASEATGRGLSGGLQRLLVSNAGRLLPQVGRKREDTASVSMASDAAHGTAHAVHAELHAVHASDRGDIGFEDEGLSRNQRRRRRQKAGRAPGRAPVAAGSLPTEDQAAAEAPSSPLVKAALAAGTTPAASSLIACSPTSVTELSPILGAVSSRRRLEEGLDAAAVEAGPTRLLQSWVELHLVPLSGSVLRTSISIGCEEARARERLEREAAASLLTAVALGFLCRRRGRLRLLKAVGVQSAARRWLARRRVRLRREGRQSSLVDSPHTKC